MGLMIALLLTYERLLYPYRVGLSDESILIFAINLSLYLLLSSVLKKLFYRGGGGCFYLFYFLGFGRFVSCSGQTLPKSITIGVKVANFSSTSSGILASN